MGVLVELPEEARWANWGEGGRLRTCSDVQEYCMRVGHAGEQWPAVGRTCALIFWGRRGEEDQRRKMILPAEIKRAQVRRFDWLARIERI